MLSYFLFFILLIFVWLLVLIAAGFSRAVEEKNFHKKSGISVIGYLVPPIFFLLITWLINLIRPQIGFWLIGALHGTIAAAAIGSTGIAAWKLNKK